MSVTWYLSVFGHGAEKARLNPSMMPFSGFVTPGERPTSGTPSARRNGGEGHRRGGTCEKDGSSGGILTVAAADGGVGLGNRPRYLQQRAAGVEQQPAVRWRPPAAPSARCHQTPRHA